jgi:hypothetical protein
MVRAGLAGSRKEERGGGEEAGFGPRRRGLANAPRRQTSPTNSLTATRLTLWAPFTLTITPPNTNTAVATRSTPRRPAAPRALAPVTQTGSVARCRRSVGVEVSVGCVCSGAVLMWKQAIEKKTSQLSSITPPAQQRRAATTVAAAAASDGAYDYDLFTIGAGSGGVRASRFAASTYGE